MLTNLQDLCSRYKFAPMTTAYMPCGEEIAGHLERHLTRFGPPLFLKRDNAGNLNHRAVNDLLKQLMVIPINSPCYSPGYNGAIEHSVGELKSWLGKFKAAAKTIRELALLLENAVYALNHRPRRCLFGKNACRTYFGSARLRYSKRMRKEAYDWISDLAIDLSARCGKNRIDPGAWRIAARKWMEKHRLIAIVKPAKVLPHFFETGAIICDAAQPLDVKIAWFSIKVPTKTKVTIHVASIDGDLLAAIYGKDNLKLIDSDDDSGNDQNPKLNVLLGPGDYLIRVSVINGETLPMFSIYYKVDET